MKTRRVTSVIECVVMGCLAFDLMVLLNRIALNGDPLEITGFILPTVLGGAVGALVRYYFVRVEQETEEHAILDDPISSALPATEPLSDEPSPVHESPGTTDVKTASPRSEQPLAPADMTPEPEPIETPAQIELWPCLAGADADEEPIQQELQLWPVLPSPPEALELPPEEHTPPGPPEEPDEEGREPDGKEAREVPPIQTQFLDWFMEDARIFCAAINPQDEIIMANRALMGALGYSAEEVMGMSFTAQLIPPRLRRDAWTDVARLSEDHDEHIRIHGLLLSKDGQEIPVEWRGTAVFDDNGGLSCCFLVGLETIEHEAPEAAATETEPNYKALYEDASREKEHYRSVLDSSADAIVMCTMQGIPTYANPAFAALFGWTLDELRVSEAPFVPESQKNLEKPIIDDLVQNGTPCRNLDTKRQAKDGSLVSTQMNAWRFRDEKDHPAGMLVMLRVIARRIKVEKASVKPISPPKKRQVSAKEIARDIRSGSTDAMLMEKYKLTAKGLQSVFEKLVEAKVLKPAEIHTRTISYDETVAIDLHRAALGPASERPKKASKPDKVSVPVQAGSPVAQGLDKYGITEDSLDDTFKRLVPQGVTDVQEPSTEPLSATQEPEDVTVRREIPRNYMVVSVPIYESNNLLMEGTIIDINEKGMKVQGIEAVKGETKSLLIQGDEFHDVFPFIFDAVCRWTTTDEGTGETLAGFQITAISQAGMDELRKLIAALSIGA
jgi:PAS domain S-box-containing protein